MTLLLLLLGGAKAALLAGFHRPVTAAGRLQDTAVVMKEDHCSSSPRIVVVVDATLLALPDFQYGGLGIKMLSDLTQAYKKRPGGCKPLCSL